MAEQLRIFRLEGGCSSHRAVAVLLQHRAATHSSLGHRTHAPQGIWNGLRQFGLTAPSRRLSNLGTPKWRLDFIADLTELAPRQTTGAPNSATSGQ